MANKFQVKRTSISGRTPNTTNSGNTHYIDTGELAINLADGKMFSSNGTAYFEVGANVVNQNITGDLFLSTNNKRLKFKDRSGNYAEMVLQDDDNFVFYSTSNSTGAARPVYAIYANSATSDFDILVPLRPSSGIVANGTIGSAGQTLTSNGTGLYWAAGAGTGTVTQVNTGIGLTGGPIDATGTISVVANNGIVANSTGVFANPGAGLVVNATGIHVNSTYIGTLAANSATYLGGNTASNLRSYSDTQAGAAYANATTFAANATNISSGTLNASRLPATAVQNTDSRTLSGNLVISGTYFNPSANTILLGNSTQRWVLSANTGSFSGAVSGITTLAAGNTTLTGFVNATSSIQGGGSLTIAGPASGITTLAAGNTTVTGFVNATSTIQGGSSLTIAGALSGVTTAAMGNTTVTGFVNATSSIQGGSSLTIAGALSGVTTAAVGNTTITGFANASVSVNSALLTVGTSFIANTTGAYHTGTVNATSHTTSGITANTSGVYPSSNTVGTALGSTTNRWILNANTGSFTGQVEINGNSWNTADGTGAVYLDSSTGNRIDWNINGVAAPAVTTRSAGTKLVLYPGVAAASVDFGLGIETNHMWFSAADTGDGFKWYANTTQLAIANTSGITLGSGGIFPTSNSSATSLGSATQRWVLNANTGSFAGAVSGITTLAAGNTTITGFANITTLSTGNTTVTGFVNASASVNSAVLAVGTSFIANSSQVTIAAGVPLSANGSTGTAGHTLHSNGATGSPYWAADDQGVTSVATGNGLTGGTITATGTISVSAQSGLLANATGLYVNATSIALGTVPTARLGTGTANSTTYLAGDQTWQTISSGGLTIVNDTSTNATRYISFNEATSGSTANLGVSSTKLTFNPSTGIVSATQFSATSDERLKQNVEVIHDPLDKISQLKGVTFNYIESNQAGVGVIAQDVEKVFPELIDINSEGYKSVLYDGLIGLLIESIKDQQKQINELKQIIEHL